MRARLAVAAALGLTIALLPTAASAASSLTLTPAEGASGTWIVVEGTCPVPDGAADAGGLFVVATALVEGEELAVRTEFTETESSGDFSVLVQILDVDGGAPVTGDEVVVEARCSDYTGNVVGTVTGAFAVTTEASCPEELPASTGELTEEATVTFLGGIPGEPIERIKADELQPGSTASLCLYSDALVEPYNGTPVSPASGAVAPGPGDIVGAAVADDAGLIDLLSVPTRFGEVTYALLGRDAQGRPFAWTTQAVVPIDQPRPGFENINDPVGSLPNLGGGDVAGLAAAGAALILLGAVTVVRAAALAGRLRRVTAG